MKETLRLFLVAVLFRGMNSIVIILTMSLLYEIKWVVYDQSTS